MSAPPLSYHVCLSLLISPFILYDEKKEGSTNILTPIWAEGVNNEKSSCHLPRGQEQAGGLPWGKCSLYHMCWAEP